MGKKKEKQEKVSGCGVVVQLTFLDFKLLEKHARSYFNEFCDDFDAK